MQETSDTPTPPKYNAPGGAARGGGASSGYYEEVRECDEGEALRRGISCVVHGG